MVRSKVVKGSLTAKSRLQENEVASNSRTPFVTIESRTAEGNAASPIPHFERDTCESVKPFIKGGGGGNVDEDGLYLKHDLEHTWSPMNSATAVGREGS